MSPRKITALVIDDSAYNRKTISEILESSGEVEVVARAADGEEGLRQAVAHTPDVITLDLEMPRMDGFTFLRILMSRQPTPVIVLSSYSKKANVFRALELGAVDFVAKPDRFISADTDAVREALLSRIRVVRGLRAERLVREVPAPEPRRQKAPAAAAGPLRLMVIGASTGGPPAVQRILAEIPGSLNVAVLVAVHMPPRFTHAFAERVDRASELTVVEAEDGVRLEAGHAYVAPGGRRTEVRRAGGEMTLAVHDPDPGDAYLPSIDALFRTAAAAARRQCLGVVLTGMGRDGREGVVALKEAGGFVLAESEETAVVYGMPKEAVATGAVDRVLRLDDIAGAMTAFAVDGTLPEGQGR